MKRLPDELVAQIIEFCQKNETGMSIVGSEDMGCMVIIMGEITFSADQVSILAAFLMLNGVITGDFMRDNAIARQLDEQIKDGKVN